jgi:16S rRNA processing protein RimM
LNKEDTIRVGKITGSHGVDGEIKLRAWGPPEDLAELAGGELTELIIDGRPYTIKGTRKHKDSVLFKLEGISTRDQAETLTGCEVSVRKKELPALGEGEYYWFELMGMEVRDEEGKGLGSIFNILATGSNEVYEVRGDLGEILIPAIEGVIVGVDKERNLMTVRLPEGLLPEKHS